MQFRRYLGNGNRRDFIFLLVFLAVLPLACKNSCNGRKQELTNYQIHSVWMNDGNVVKYRADYIPKNAFFKEPIPRKTPPDTLPPKPPEKIHPVLRKWLVERLPSEQVRLMINFKDNVKIHQLPDPLPNEPRDSKANQQIQARVDSLIRGIKAKRAAGYDSLKSELGQKYGAQILDTYWLINCVLVEMMLGNAGRLAERPDVLYIAPQNAGEQPPDHDGIPNNDVDDARLLIGSDPLFNAIQPNANEYIGLLDTGIRPSHILFNPPSFTFIGERYNCVGASDCSAANVNEDNCYSHGTASAAIISGNDRKGNPYRGVTKFTIDSYKIYTCSGLDRAAAVHGFEKALARYNRIIVAEMQAIGNEVDEISLAADNAFDAGAVIVAANGNDDDGQTLVKAPAIAHKVIGVGAFDVIDNQKRRLATQCFGPTYDGRHKPDIQAPSRTETASNVPSDDTALKDPPLGFGGTSGAVPYVGGAAALLRNWYKRVTGNQIPHPGQIYALLILSGQLTSQIIAENQPTRFDECNGTGPINLPMSNGRTVKGAVLVANNETVNIPLSITEASATNLNAAIWWGEQATGPHNDIDLYLVDPSNNEVTRSNSIYSVFERARWTGSLASVNNWTIRIRGYSVLTGSQMVYWAAHYNTP